MNTEDFNELVDKFKEVDSKSIPTLLLLELKLAQTQANKHLNELEKCTQKTMDLMRLAIVLDGVNKSKK